MSAVLAFAEPPEKRDKPAPSPSPSASPSPAPKEGPAAQGELKGVPSNHSQDRQLKDMGFGPNGGDKGRSGGDKGKDGGKGNDGGKGGDTKDHHGGVK